MAGEDNFDSNSPAFREASVPSVYAVLQEKSSSIRSILQNKDRQQLQETIIKTADDIDRIVVASGKQGDIYSTLNTAIVHALGLTVWRKPVDTQRVESENLEQIIDKLVNGQMDKSRFAKGVYLLEVLLHKYKDGNGRVARAMKLLLDKVDGSDIGEDDTRKILGINRESHTQTGEHSFTINFNPDFERLVLGVAYFGLHKGLTQEQVTQLKLNNALPEEGLRILSRKLGVEQERLKKEFIRFMVVDSDLEWCNFDN